MTTRKLILRIAVLVLLVFVGRWGLESAQEGHRRSLQRTPPLLPETTDYSSLRSPLAQTQTGMSVAESIGHQFREMDRRRLEAEFENSRRRSTAARERQAGRQQQSIGAITVVLAVFGALFVIGVTVRELGGLERPDAAAPPPPDRAPAPDRAPPPVSPPAKAECQHCGTVQEAPSHGRCSQCGGRLAIRRASTSDA